MEGLPQRKNLPHGTPSWVRDDAIYFITACCRPKGVNQLCLDPVASIIWESIEFRQTRGDWHVHLWLLMPDHFHALISFPREVRPARVLAGWKEMVAKRTSVHWQRDFFDHRLRSLESHEEKAAYIRQNPVRKALVRDAAEWKFVWEPA
ncbi:MAG TPA: hypothetical protein VHD61_09315 [Lacunisphaera sp.]|nr:hypothetical protein [Lacunisphaera sp.]